MHKPVQELWLGLIDYNKAWELQKTLSEQARLTGQGFLIGCEHPNVITYGTRFKNTEIQNTENLPSVKTNRGGLATLHNPGQLLIYPILPIKKYDFNVRSWVEYLIKITEDSLNLCNIIIIDKNNGAFSKNGKIASVGINISKGISTHGVAINVSNDLRLFQLFSPCGIANQPMDRVAHYAPELQPSTLFRLWCEKFQQGLAFDPNFLTETGSVNRT